MTPNTMRSFAGGLIIATALCSAVYFNGPAEAAKDTKIVEKTQKIKNLSEEEMIEQLTSKGYVVQTESEWNKELAAAKKSDEKVATAENDKKDKPKNEQKVVYRTILNISSGMTSIDVGKALKRANIIEDPFQFSKEVEKKGVATKLRLGIFEIDSGMTTDEIISIIFKS